MSFKQFVTENDKPLVFPEDINLDENKVFTPESNPEGASEGYAYRFTKEHFVSHLDLGGNALDGAYVLVPGDVMTGNLEILGNDSGAQEGIDVTGRGSVFIAFNYSLETLLKVDNDLKVAKDAKFFGTQQVNRRIGLVDAVVINADGPVTYQNTWYRLEHDFTTYPSDPWPAPDDYNWALAEEIDASDVSDDTYLIKDTDLNHVIRVVQSINGTIESTATTNIITPHT